jgi:hypothetical protein
MYIIRDVLTGVKSPLIVPFVDKALAETPPGNYLVLVARGVTMPGPIV